MLIRSLVWGQESFANLGFAQILIQTVLLSYLTVCYKIHLCCTDESGIGSEEGICHFSVFRRFDLKGLFSYVTADQV
jgi:hypothetical protein